MIIIDTSPIDNSKNNPVYEYTYDETGNLTQLDMILADRTYRKTFVWVGTDLTDETAWAEV